jgi:hypothetical protein
MGGLWGANDYLVSILADLQIPLLWEKIHIWHGIPIHRAVLLIGCTALHFSHSPWSLKLYGCLCQRHSPIATNGSHGHCISVSAESLGVHREPGVWFCLVWWSQGISFPNNRTFPRWLLAIAIKVCSDLQYICSPELPHCADSRSPVHSLFFCNVQSSLLCCNSFSVNFNSPKWRIPFDPP